MTGGGRSAAARRRIVFDFAGVVFGWQPVALLQQVLPRRATDAASAAFWAAQIFQGYGGDWAEFDRGSVEPDALVARIAGRTGLGADEVQAVVDAVPLALQPVPETVALLDRLRGAGRPLYFLSNMPASYADHLERSHPFLGHFADGVISARVKLIKPEPAIFKLAAQRFGVAPADLFFLDDHAPNVAAAQAAGWRAQQFSDAAQAEQALRDAGWWPYA
jgi:putative hydrolase of the HAD superfamily